MLVADLRLNKEHHIFSKNDDDKTKLYFSNTVFFNIAFV